MTHLVDEGKAVNVYPEIGKVFDTISHRETGCSQLGNAYCLLCKNWLEGWAQRVVENGVTFS